jgi:hypothetical protein
MLAGQCPLSPTEFRQGGLLVSRVRLPVAVGGREERLQADVDADRRIRAGLDLEWPQIAGEDDVPAPRLAPERGFGNSGGLRSLEPLIL